MKRKVIEINRDECNGCGLCTTACAENALVLDEEGKAKLVREIYCDGMGACLDVCPTGALKIIERDCEEYDPNAAYEYVKATRGAQAAEKVHGIEEVHRDGTRKNQDSHHHHGREAEHGERLGCGCPGSMAREIKKAPVRQQEVEFQGKARSELSQWPIQLHLVSPAAPYFNECDLLIAADCTAFALGSFHQELLKGKKLVIACPKLDNTSHYVDKLADIIRNNTIYSLTVAIMTVPCCSGMYRIVQEAVEKSGKHIAVKKVLVDLDGSIV